MMPNALPDDILRLPAEQQLRLEEDAWDRIAAPPTHVPVPERHRAELDQRLADPTGQATLSWGVVKARIMPTP